MSGLDSLDRRLGDVSVVSGAIYGVLAYEVGLALVFVLYSATGTQAPYAEALGLWATYYHRVTVVGLVFYGAHLVPTAVGDGAVLNFALLQGPGVGYVLLVVGSLGATGAYLGSADGVETLRDGLLAGASLAVGYLPLVVVGTLAFPALTTGAELAVPVFRAVLLAGVAFPVVLGGAGGALAARS